jgi:hypothetical protein
LLLCGLACGDRVVVARGLSLVSAAESSGDAGFGELDVELQDAGLDAADPAVEKPFDFAPGTPGYRPPPPAPSSPPPGGHGAAPEKEQKRDKARATGEQGQVADAGHGSNLEHH